VINSENNKKVFVTNGAFKYLKRVKQI